MTEVARSQHAGDPLPVELLDQAPVGSRLVFTFGDLGGPRPTVAKIYDRVGDGWSYREQPDWETIDSVLLADCWVSKLLSWRLHHPGIVRVVPWHGGARIVCSVTGCRVPSQSGFWDVVQATRAARHHVVRHIELARAS